MSAYVPELKEPSKLLTFFRDCGVVLLATAAVATAGLAPALQTMIAPSTAPACKGADNNDYTRALRADANRIARVFGSKAGPCGPK